MNQTLADLARAVGMPPNRFAQAFVSQTGQSPHPFALAVRVQRAAALLAGSTLSLGDIAHAGGFAIPQHLSKVMRRCLGTTPGRYRATRLVQDAGSPLQPSALLSSP